MERLAGVVESDCERLARRKGCGESLANAGREKLRAGAAVAMIKFVHSLFIGVVELVWYCYSLINR